MYASYTNYLLTVLPVNVSPVFNLTLSACRLASYEPATYSYLYARISPVEACISFAWWVRRRWLQCRACVPVCEKEIRPSVAYILCGCFAA